MRIITVGKSSPLKYSGSHIHDVWEIILNLEGEGEMTVGDERFRFSAGDVVCIPPRTPHTKMSDDKFVDIFAKLGGIKINSAKYLKFSDSDNSVNHLLTMMHRIYHRRERNFENITEQLSLALEELVIGRTESKSYDKRTEHIISVIVEHYCEPDFSVSEAMTRLGYCEDHIRRIFCRDTGKTPLEYITDVRIDHAKKLLRESKRLNYTIAEVATASGYADISYFSRVFKKHTGMSPREYLIYHNDNSVSAPNPVAYDNCCGDLY